MGDKKTISALVSGGEANAGPPLGPALGPLPLEEAVFFLVTNLLVVQGLLLFLYPPGRGAGSSQTLASPGGATLP